MLHRDRLTEIFFGVGLLTVAATLLLLTYADNWFTAARVRTALGVIAVCAIAVIFLSRRKSRKIGCEVIESRALRLAGRLDRQGKPCVFPRAKRPAGRHYLIFDSEIEASDRFEFAASATAWDSQDRT